MMDISTHHPQDFVVEQKLSRVEIRKKRAYNFGQV